jgi:RNA polymerase sigma-70 factor (ECF subfamily)
VVTVNRAVAVGRADGPRAGIALLLPVLAAGRLAGYAPLHAAHADLLERAGDEAGAVAAWRRAAELSRNAAEQAALERRASGG